MIQYVSERIRSRSNLKIGYRFAITKSNIISYILFGLKGLTHKKNGNTTQNNHNFFEFSSKIEGMAHKNEKLLGLSRNFMQTHKKAHKKTHKNFL